MYEWEKRQGITTVSSATSFHRRSHTREVLPSGERHVKVSPGRATTTLAPYQVDITHSALSPL